MSSFTLTVVNTAHSASGVVLSTIARVYIPPSIFFKVSICVAPAPRFETVAVIFSIIPAPPLLSMTVAVSEPANHL